MHDRLTDRQTNKTYLTGVDSQQNQQSEYVLHDAFKGKQSV